MAGTIVVDRIESDASYASTINVAGQITFSNTVNFGVFAGTAPVAGMYLPATNNLAFTTASTERMRIDNQGNVGIGTASPGRPLDVNGVVRVRGPIEFTSASTSVTGYVGDNNQIFGSSAGDTALYSMAGALRFYAGSTTERMRIDSSGNVGIGTSSPAAHLEISGTETGSGSSFKLTNTTASTGKTWHLNSNNSGKLFFSIPSVVDAMIIDSSGNVGIGTASPSYLLHAQISSATNPAGYFYNTSGSSNSPALIARGGANNANAARIISAQDYDGTEEFGISGTGELRLNAGFGSAGIGYVCRVWVNYSATAGSTSIRGSGNISSITYNAVGDHTLNFFTAMPDANYALIGYSGQASGDARHIGAITSQTTSAIRYLVQYISNTGGGGTAINNTNNHFAIFR